MNDYMKIKNLLGDINYNYIINKHNDVITKIVTDNHTDDFIRLMKNYSNLNFFNALYSSVRVILLNYYKIKKERKYYGVNYIIPEEFKSMNFVIKREIENFEDLNNIFMNHLFLLPEDELIIDKVGINNLQKFDNDTHYLSTELQSGYTKYNFLFNFTSYLYHNKKLEYKIPSYDKFLNLIHDYILYLKTNKDKSIYLNYRNFPDYFKNKFPDLFIDEDMPNDLKVRFYLGKITLSSIEKDIEYLPKLKNKNLEVLFSDKIYIMHNNQDINFIKFYIDKFGRNAFIELVSSFGYLLNSINNKEIDITLPKKIFDKKIRSHIYQEIKNTETRYEFIAKSTFYNARKFKEEYSSLFLDENVPTDLKENFYEGLTFRYLSNNRRYLKYIKDKDFITSLIKCEDISTIKFFELLKDDAIRVILNNPDTISKALKEDKLDQLCFWYIKTNRSYIPDYSVIKIFPTNQINNFINNRNKWKGLLKSKTFNKEENREVLLKLAYVMGVFNYDDTGFKKLQEIILDVPKKLSKNNAFFINIMRNFDNNDNKYMSVVESKVSKIKKSFIKEGLKIDKFHFIDNIYKSNEDGTCTLMINMQEYPKSTILLREFMEENELEGLLTPEICDDLFSDFKMKYNSEFKDLLINNFNKIMNDDNYRFYISHIQRKFDEIKKFNCNRKINLEIALDYVKNNSLEYVDLGNELLADHMSKIGYNQEKYNRIQEIYNIGKRRLYSSIPRIYNKTDKYQYEIVRLDDITPLEVGELTDCCQKLDALGESCMIHSMIDKNGRLFVIKDLEGNLISESWVWRNKDVICFDNIEIPKKVMINNGYNPLFVDRKLKTKFGDEILDVYIKASKDIYNYDNESYKKLLDNNLITEEQYNELRVKKITIGRGFSSIIGSLDYYLKKDQLCESPLLFDNVITKDNSLYIRDSRTQYIVINEKEKKSTLENIYPYIDDYEIYDENNLDEIKVFKIKREHLFYNNESDFINFGMEGKEFINDLNNYYSSNNIKIIMNSIFTIIFEEKEDEIIIKDYFYNKEIDKKTIEITLKNAVNQLNLKKTCIIPEYLIEISEKKTNILCLKQWF